jgi:opacity protein-like surface antigen
VNKLSLAAAAVAVAIAAPAFAADVSNTFNVNITLTPKCEIFNESGATSTIGNLAMSYTSFQTSSSIGSTSFKVRCTNSQGYSLALDSASVTDGTTGLAYTLNLSTSASHAATTNASLSSLSGNGNGGQTYHVHGNIAANQDGTVSAGTANNTRTLTITY